MKYFYAIMTTVNERSARYQYITDTLEDAEAHRNEFCDWYGAAGDVAIHKIDQHFNVVENISYIHGKVWEHYIRDNRSMIYLVKNGKKVNKK